MVKCWHRRLTLGVMTEPSPNSGKLFSFTDALDIVDNVPIVVKARIAVVPTSEGGRHGPFTKGFRPNHNFGGPDDRLFYIGQIEVAENEWVFPGDSREFLVTFLNVRGLREKLVSGRSWRIQEGPKLIATGTVLELVGEHPS